MNMDSTSKERVRRPKKSLGLITNRTDKGRLHGPGGVNSAYLS